MHNIFQSTRPTSASRNQNTCLGHLFKTASEYIVTGWRIRYGVLTVVAPRNIVYAFNWLVLAWLCERGNAGTTCVRYTADISRSGHMTHSLFSQLRTALPISRCLSDQPARVESVRRNARNRGCGTAFYQALIIFIGIPHSCNGIFLPGISAMLNEQFWRQQVFWTINMTSLSFLWPVRCLHACISTVAKVSWPHPRPAQADSSSEYVHVT